MVNRVREVTPIVKNFMTTNGITIDAQKTVIEATKLMRQQGIGDLVVVRDKILKVSPLTIVFF
ncbi:MAG: hypothetical protein QG670_1564 [Thermoproteota archaeon]|nr:hypothetical protein [Thermoproteota archaeon]